MQRADLAGRRSLSPLPPIALRFIGGRAEPFAAWRRVWFRVSFLYSQPPGSPYGRAAPLTAINRRAAAYVALL